jgi:hypothetical protein
MMNNYNIYDHDEQLQHLQRRRRRRSVSLCYGDSDGLRSLLQSADDQHVDITQRSCTESHKTLGVHDNPFSNHRTEYDHLFAKGRNMAQLISAQTVTRPEAWTAYRDIYRASMSYSLPVTSFTRQELDKIQRRPIQVLLSAMGFNRNMPRAVVFGPASLGGIGLHRLYIEQGSLKTMVVLGHIRHNGRLGQ